MKRNRSNIEAASRGSWEENPKKRNRETTKESPASRPGRLSSQDSEIIAERVEKEIKPIIASLRRSGNSKGRKCPVYVGANSVIRALERNQVDILILADCEKSLYAPSTELLKHIEEISKRSKVGVIRPLLSPPLVGKVRPILNQTPTRS